MSNVIGNLFGGGSAKAAQAAAAANEATAQSDQGRQLALLSKQDATNDNSQAAMNAPGIGRAMLGFTRRTSGTLGG